MLENPLPLKISCIYTTSSEGSVVTGTFTGYVLYAQDWHSFAFKKEKSTVKFKYEQAHTGPQYAVLLLRPLVRDT